MKAVCFHFLVYDYSWHPAVHRLSTPTHQRKKPPLEGGGFFGRRFQAMDFSVIQAQHELSLQSQALRLVWVVYFVLTSLWGPG
jgi:hypothetical protein